ncbi:hypothetical protein GN956_G26613 [Arapaima gigas]
MKRDSQHSEALRKMSLRDAAPTLHQNPEPLPTDPTPGIGSRRYPSDGPRLLLGTRRHRGGQNAAKELRHRCRRSTRPQRTDAALIPSTLSFQSAGGRGEGGGGGALWKREEEPLRRSISTPQNVMSC